MRWIGLTGGIASGKSSVACVFMRNGIPVVSADALAHEVMQPGSPAAEQIVAEFGRSVVTRNGEIDRAGLGSLVFSDLTGDRLRKLESILHPLVRMRARDIRDELEKKGHALAVYEVPLLFEREMQGLFDQIVCVAVHPITQAERLMARNRISPAEAYQRIHTQAPVQVKIEGSDIVIWNNGSAADLERIADTVARELITNSSQNPK